MELKLSSDRGRDIKAIFRTGGSPPLSIELVIRFGTPGRYSSDVRSEIVRQIEDMRYCGPLAGDCIECNLQQVKVLARRCREGARLKSEDVTATVHFSEETVYPIISTEQEHISQHSPKSFRRLSGQTYAVP
jgi:hypothetical protein